MASNKNQTSALQKQFINVDLTQGVDLKQDPHQFTVGRLKTCDNAVYSVVEGQVTKRFGCSAITPQGASFQGGPFKAIGCRDNVEPIILGQNTLNRYNVQQNLSTSLPIPTQVRLDSQNVAGSSNTNNEQYPPFNAQTCTDGSSYAAIVYEEPLVQNQVRVQSSNIFFGIQDLLTQNWIVPPYVLTGPKTQTIGGVVYTLTSINTPQINYNNGQFFISFVWSGSGTSGSNTVYASNILFYSVALTNIGAAPTLNSYSITCMSGGSSVGYYVPACHMASGKFICAFNDYTSDLNTKTFIGTISGTTLSQQSTNTQTVSGGNYINGGPKGAQGIHSSRISVKCDGPSSTPYAVLVWSRLYIFTSAYALVTGGNNQNLVSSESGMFLDEPISVKWVTGNANYNLLVLVPVRLYQVNGGTTNVNGRANGIQVNKNIINGTATPANYSQTVLCPPVAPCCIQLLSEPFLDNSGTVCFWVGGGSNWSDVTYNTAYLLGLPSGSLVGGILARTNYLGNPANMYGDRTNPTQVIAIPSSQKKLVYLSTATEKISSSLSFGTLSRVVTDFNPSRMPQIIALPAGGNMIAGGMPLYYDGNAVVEMGFSAAPDFTNSQQVTTQATQSSQSFSLATNSTSGIKCNTNTTTKSGYDELYYTMCFVRRDAYGNVHRSAPSPVVTVPLSSGSGTYVSVTFPPVAYVGGGNVAVEFYRSAITTPGTYYFVGQVPLGQSFVDISADSANMANRTVYTNSGELPNDPPPAAYHVAMSESRGYMIPADNRNVVWYSKQFSPGRTIEWCANLTLSEGLNSGQFTGLAVMDSNLIVFKADQIIYTYGNGPDNTGANGGFVPFQKVASDVGCIDPASIAVVPNGVLFRSRRGIEMLTRSLQVVYVGGPVEPAITTMDPLSSAVIMPGYSELRFVPSTAGQPVLVYDYMKNRWSTFSSMASVQAVAILGNYWWISADGTTVFQETPGAYLDNGNPIIMTLETLEIPVGAAGAQGWGRVYRMALLGDFFSNHTLNVSYAYDHQSTYTDSSVFNTSNGLISGDQVYQFRCSRMPRSAMQALRLKFQDSGTTGQSCAISDLVLEVASKNGLARLSPAKTV